MQRKTRKPAGLRARLSITALALAVAAAAGVGTGTATAAKHDRHHHGGHHHGSGGHWQPPGPGDPGHGQQPPSHDPVPGVDYATAPEDLAPPAITVLANDPATDAGNLFVAPKAADLTDESRPAGPRDPRQRG